jgi:hypothetical protein
MGEGLSVTTIRLSRTPQCRVRCAARVDLFGTEQGALTCDGGRSLFVDVDLGAAPTRSSSD